MKKIIVAALAALALLSACYSPGKGETNGITRSCVEGRGFAVLAAGGGDPAGLVRVPEWDETCP